MTTHLYLIRISPPSVLFSMSGLASYPSGAVNTLEVES